MDRWVGKVSIVTGASSGIGAAVAERFVEEGMQVVGLARRVEKIEELARSLEGKKGKLHALKVDMTKEEEILDAFKWTLENVGPVHVLVNNAGTSKNTSLMAGDTDMWKTVFDTNVIGLLIATREAISIMQGHEIDGHIIHMNSVYGHTICTVPGPGSNVYSASKYAVTNLTETLRNEFNRCQSKIKISSISPGAVETKMLEDAVEALLAMDQKIPPMPVLKPSDVADAVIYVLATPPHVQIHELLIKPIGELF